MNVIKISDLYDQTDAVTDIADKVTVLKGKCDALLNTYPKDVNDIIIGRLDEIQKINTEIDLDKQNIKSLNSELSKMNINIINDRLKRIEILKKSIDSLKEQNGVLKNNINEVYPTKIEELDKKIEKAKKESENKTELEKKIEFCEKIINSTERIYSELETSIHQKLQKITSEEFTKIHWKDSYKNVLIDENFNVSFEKKDGDKLIATDPSSGTQLILALSFIIALNSLSGFKLPLIIDTPLSRLDNDLRESLAEYLPSFLKGKQMTLIVTNSEYTGMFKEKIKKYVGIEYKLEYHDDDGEYTKVIQC